MIDDLVDRIYEAAFVPEKWLGVIAELARVSGSATGGMLLFRPEQAVSGAPRVFRLADVAGVLALEQFDEAMRRLIAEHPSHAVQRVERWFALRLSGYQGFVRSTDVLSREELERDPPQQGLAAVGLEAEICLVTPTSGSEAVLQALQRRAGDGRFDEDGVAALNVFGPHLSRASLLAARLGLAHAISTVSALGVLGLPAAVMRGKGSVLATNVLFDRMETIFRPAAFGRVMLADSAADSLFNEALESVRARRSNAVRSIPIRGHRGAPAAVVHVLPLVRSAFDIFSGAEILVVATEISPANGTPPPSLLIDLYDLTPAEARLAASLSSGRSLGAAAKASGITVKSGRTYLERIFAKTGAHRQSELVALLRSVPPLGDVERWLGPR